MNLSKQHCADVLNRWAAHHVKTAQKRCDEVIARETEENVQRRIASAVEEERKRADPYYGVGWGEPTVEQRFDETSKRVREEASKAYRILQNNKEFQVYIAEITKNDLGT